MSQRRTTILDNNLRVITEVVPGTRSTSIGILVNASPQTEPSNKRGVAHLLEHAVFLGTSSRSARDISAMIDEAGGQMGAFTSRDYTCFHAHTMDDYGPYAWELLGDIFLNSTFPEDALMRERDVVLQELGMYQRDQSAKLHEILKRNIWPNHPLGREVAGTPESVCHLNREDVIYFLGQHYLPDNMTISMTGNIDHDHAVAQATDTFWRLLGSTKPSKSLPCEFESTVTIGKSESPHAHCALALPSEPYQDESRYSVHTLNTILGGGMSSRLFSKLRESLGWVYDVHSSYDAYRDGGAIIIEGICAAEDLMKILSHIVQEFEAIANDAVTEEELCLVKRKIMGQHQLASDSVNTRMSRILTQDFYFDRPLDEEEISSGISDVTCESIQKAAQKMLEPERIGISALIRNKNAIDVDQCLALLEKQHV